VTPQRRSSGIAASSASWNCRGALTYLCPVGLIQDKVNPSSGSRAARRPACVQQMMISAQRIQIRHFGRTTSSGIVVIERLPVVEIAFVRGLSAGWESAGAGSRYHPVCDGLPRRVGGGTNCGGLTGTVHHDHGQRAQRFGHHSGDVGCDAAMATSSAGLSLSAAKAAADMVRLKCVSLPWCVRIRADSAGLRVGPRNMPAAREPLSAIPSRGTPSDRPSTWFP